MWNISIFLMCFFLEFNDDSQKSCCEFIQRTVRSGKNWLRYSSSSSIHGLNGGVTQLYILCSTLTFAVIDPTFGRPPSFTLIAIKFQKWWSQNLWMCKGIFHYRLFHKETFLQEFHFTNCCRKLLPYSIHCWIYHFRNFSNMVICSPYHILFRNREGETWGSHLSGVLVGLFLMRFLEQS